RALLCRLSQAGARRKLLQRGAQQGRLEDFQQPRFAAAKNRRARAGRRSEETRDGSPRAATQGRGRGTRRGHHRATTPDRRNQSDGGRQKLSEVAVQPGVSGKAPAGIGLQTLRLSRRVDVRRPKRNSIHSRQRVERQPVYLELRWAKLAADQLQ